MGRSKAPQTDYSRPSAGSSAALGFDLKRTEEVKEQMQDGDNESEGEKETKE